MKHCGAPEKGLKIIETSNILAEETSNSVVSISLSLYACKMEPDGRKEKFQEKKQL